MTMMYTILAGSTDVSVVIRIIDSTDGTPETGVVFNTSGIDLEYRREGAASTDITEATLAALTTAHTDGGFLHIGNGYYRLDLPDAAVASGATGVLIHGTVTGMVVIGCYIQLVAYNPFDSVRLGLTALPNAAAGANGGLPTGNASGQVAVASLANSSITAASIASDAITSAKIADGAIDAATFAAGAIDAAAIATDAIGSAEISAAAVTKIQSGLSTYAGGDTSGTTTLLSRLTSTRAGLLDNLDAAISSRLATAGYTSPPSAATIAAAVWDYLTSAATTVGSLGKLIVDNLNATISSRLASASYTAPLDAAGVRSAVGLASANLDTQLTAIDDAVDTEVSAIKAVTDKLDDTLEDSGGGAYIFTSAALAQAPGGLTVQAIVDGVWDEPLADHLDSGTTGAGVNAAGSAGDPWATSLPGAYGVGTAGKIVGDNINATVSSRATQTSVDTIDDFLDTEVAAIKAKTDNLPTDPADQSAVESAITSATSGLATQASVNTIDDFLDTEIAAIKAKTDALPAAPAATGDIPSAAAVASQVRTELATELGRVDAAVSTRLATAGYTTPPTANENADALLKRDWTAVTGEAARSVLNAMRFLRNKWSVSGSTLTVTKEDDSTSAWTASVTSDAEAEPITGSDPA
jgi:hypothetical protein